MVAFKNRSSKERVATLQRVMKRLENAQANEDTPPVDMNDILRGMRYLVDHLTILEDDLESIEDLDYEYEEAGDV